MKSGPRRKKILVVIGHGRTQSLCHHLSEVVIERLKEAGCEIRLQDLLADGFDPILRLSPEERHVTACSEEQDALAHRYQEEVRWAEAYVIVHPVWWFAPPAILKGWVDRILCDGVALTQREEDPPSGNLGGRRALVVQTYNAARAIDKVVFRGMAEVFWRRAVFLSVGILKVKRFALYSAADLTEKKLAAQIKRLRRSVDALIE